MLKIVAQQDKDLKSIIGIDSSSVGIGWTHLYDGKQANFGKLDLSKKKSMQDKLSCIAEEFTKILQECDPEVVYIEKSIFVRNPATARTLSYIVGSIMTLCLMNGHDVYDIEPITWKAWLGYTNLSSKFVREVNAKLGKEGKKFCEQLRKSQTKRVIQHNFPDYELTDDHDINDSCGLALYGYNQSVKTLTLEKSKAIALDQAVLASLGLTL